MSNRRERRNNQRKLFKSKENKVFDRSEFIKTIKYSFIVTISFTLLMFIFFAYSYFSEQNLLDEINKNKMYTSARIAEVTTSRGGKVTRYIFKINRIKYEGYAQNNDNLTLGDEINVKYYKSDPSKNKYCNDDDPISFYEDVLIPIYYMFGIMLLIQFLILAYYKSGFYVRKKNKQYNN